VSDGKLKIVAKKESYTDQGVTKQYTSARLNSKFAFKYGTVEVRAKLPAGQGTWPAIWTLGANINEPGAYYETLGLGTTPWATCGEIDIMEQSDNKTFSSSAIHFKNEYGQHEYYTNNRGGDADLTTDFHIYKLVWNSSSIQTFVCAESSCHSVLHESITDPKFNDEFHHDHYLLLNIAMGGKHVGDIDANFDSATMEVDYVRVSNQGGSIVWEDNFD
jgi:beta-glucanase (GH16 family)